MRPGAVIAGVVLAMGCADKAPLDLGEPSDAVALRPDAALDLDMAGDGGAASPPDAPDAPNAPPPDARVLAGDTSLPADGPVITDAADAAVPSDAGPVHPDTAEAPDAGQDAAAPPPVPGARHPIVFVHGINGGHANFDVMVARFEEAGWPRAWLVALDYPDPAWGCNVDNAAFLDRAVERLRRDTGEARVDLIAHSMGTLSSRFYLQRLGGHEVVTRYVTLGGLHHGNQWSCLNPLPVCVWQELCPTNPFLSDLNGDPDAPGTDVAVSICSSSDETADLETCTSDTMENVQVDGPTHGGPTGLLEDPAVFDLVRGVMER